MGTKKIVILPKLYSGDDDPSNRWFVFFSYRDPNAGKMKIFRVYKGFSELTTTEEKKRHGKKLIREITRKINRGWTPYENKEFVYQDKLQYDRDINKSRRGKGLNYHMNRFLDSLNGIRPATYTTYKSKFRYYEKFINEHIDLRGNLYLIEQSHANDFQTYLYKDRKLKNKTINEYNVLLKAFYGYLVRNEILQKNIFAHLKKRQEEIIKPRIYDGETLKKIVSKAKEDDPQMYLVIQIIYSCFIRPGELRYVKIKDIDFANGFIRIRSDVSKVKIQRMTVVPDHIMKKLRDTVMGKYDDEMYLISQQGVPSTTPVNRNYLYSRFVKLKKSAGIPKGYIMYAFKHTGMVDLKRAGADWLAIRNQAGHKSLDQTIEYTTELMGDDNWFLREKSPII